MPLDTAVPTPPLQGAEAAVAIAAALAEGDVVWAAATEDEAQRIGEALAVADPDARVVVLPESDAMPGAGLAASAVNIGRRRAALTALAEGAGDRRTALVTTIDALAHRWPAPGPLAPEAATLAVGGEEDLAALTDQLIALGYWADDRVDEAGEVALRGQVLDVFPVQSPTPVRIEVEDGRITSISAYDVVDQRRLDEADSVTILPATEPAIDDGGAPLTDWLPGAALVIDEGLDERRRALVVLAEGLTENGGAALRGLLTDEQWAAAMDGRRVLSPEAGGAPPPRFVESRAPARAFRRVVDAARAAGERIALLGSPRDLRFVARETARLLGTEVTPAASWAEVTVAAPGAVLSLPVPAERGFRRDGILAIAAADLLGSRARRGDEGAAALAALPDMAALRIGDVAIHEDHGLGVVEGLETIPATSETPAADAIRLGYAGGATRLVPVGQAHKLWRYGAEPEAVTLDRLDGDSWRKRRAGVSEAVEETAAGLVALAEERAGAEAPVLAAEPAAYERFCAGFPFPPTADQHRAFEAIADDLASGRPMDRLVIGDVGFGKTEVALRAAAIAVLAGKQVAIAAPTTVLARQHAETFARRFAPLKIEVGTLTRLTPAAERKRVRAGLADGSIRIAVGTAALAGKGAEYADLGLVVIDEEQRFGAADKGKLRALGAAHVLTMTATPIPRTLQAAMIGLQQMSVLATPPARRQPIRTTLAEFDPALIRAALLREKAQGGQSFVVVPKIAGMDPLAEELARIVPDLTVLKAHGKLPAAEIDEAMIRFAGGDGDVLLATNIIEAGLDVPRANTMIISGAADFGLAQLHQLRGRVGRGARRGHMLMLTEAGRELAPATARRLQTMEVLTRLGAGFDISARDLDLRGAGDLMGEQQSGHVKLIGVDLYQQMLADALARLRGGEGARWAAELNFGVDARVPEAWIADPDTRLEVHMRLARVARPEAVDAMEAELEDRFGELPPEAQNLLALARVRADAQRLGIARIVAGPKGIVLYPAPGASVALPGVEVEQKDDCSVIPEAIEDPLARLARAAALLRDAGPVEAEAEG